MLLPLVLACARPAPPGTALQVDAPLHPALVEQSRLFQRRVLEPAPGVRVFVGYALANVIVLEGPTGLVVVDSTESRTAATEVLAELRARTDKPIAALVLTHNHADHVFGGQVFVEEAGGDLPVWAHESTEAGIDRIVNVLRDAIEVRSLRMFGSMLPPEREVGDGIGFRLRFEKSDIALARPTHSFDERATVEAGGLRLELVHAPGETDDQLFAWLPEQRVLLPADNIYQAFPNLYTIRGTAYRDVRAWVDSLDAMRELSAEVLVPQHTLPVVGAAEVDGILTAYRDAIQYVHDQTVRGINAGRTPDQLAAELRLPPHLAGHPWLAEHYGRVPWAVRGIYAGTLGWFDGRGATLEPLPPDERARRYAVAFAAGQPLPEQAAAALDSGDLAWAAELGQLWVEAEPESGEARALLATALEGLGRGHLNANAHNWYLTEARELRGEVRLAPSPPSDAPLALVDGLPLDAFMAALPTRLVAERTLDVDWRAAWHFTDVDRHFLLHVRHGVAELRERPAAEALAAEVDLRFTSSAVTWKRVASGHRAAAAAVLAGELHVQGGLAEVSRFQRWFER